MDRVLYCKSSNERGRRFSLHTLLMEEENGSRYLFKMPDTPEAGPHVQRIAECEKKLKEYYGPDQVQINRCRLQDDGVRLEYLEGTTLEEEIDRAFSEKGAEAAEEMIELFFRRTQPENRLQPFRETDGFRAVFGSHPELEGLPAVTTADIDMIFSNVICNADGWHLIDYEWTFFFPVPAEFLRYRALHYYLETSSRREWLRDIPAAKWGIGEQRCVLWETMERAFQDHILDGYTPLQELYVQMSPGATDLKALDDLDRRFRADAVRVYWSENEELSEEQTLVFPLAEGWNTIRARLPEGTKRIRLDPGERSAVCSLRKWNINGKKARITAHNGVQISDLVWIFPGNDPQWTAVSEREPMSALEVEIKVQQMDADLLEAYAAEAGKGKHRRRFF